MPVHEVPLTGDLKLDLDAMLAKAGGSGLVYICNPNNPTSTIVPSADVKRLIEQVAKASPATTVLVDEAYFEYADDPAYAHADPARRRVSAVVIARTFSKIHGMAGMRVGYAIAQEKTLAAMREHHSASGISVMSLAAAAASLADTAAMQKNQLLNRQTSALHGRRIREGRLQGGGVAGELRHGGRAARRHAGFIEAVRQKGVYIGRPFPPLDQLGPHHRRHAGGDGPRAADHARVAEGAGHVCLDAAAAGDLRLLVLRPTRWHSHAGSFSSDSRAPPAPR